MENRIKKLLNISFVWLLFLPALLIYVDGSVRTSISNYAYSHYNYVFVALLTFAGAMLVVDGCKDDTITRNKWYSIVLGLSLIGVAVSPHKDYTVIHYSFAAIFFLGSLVAMVLFSSPKQRFLKMIFALIILVSMIGHFAFNWYSLLIAEWIGMLPIIINFTGENNNKLD
jgi:hypothetical membrane protein